MAEEKFTAEEWGRKMAQARAASLTAKQRKEIAQKAAKARWGEKAGQAGGRGRRKKAAK